MIVSILQLMGFAVGKPVHSRASDNPDHASAKGDKGGITASDADRKPGSSQLSESKAHAQAHSARRQEVKTQAVKAKPAAKATKLAVKGKPAPKAAPVAKSKTKAAPLQSSKAAASAKTKTAKAAPSAKVTGLKWMCTATACHPE